jgi:hypothetical protein
MKKTIDDKINRIDNSKRLNKKVERKYERLENKISKAKGDTEKLKKIDRKYGYNYEAATKSGLTPDETGHWGSIDPNTGMILKGKRHPSIIKTKKIERVLGNKIIKKGGERYSIPRKK